MKKTNKSTKKTSSKKPKKTKTVDENTLLNVIDIITKKLAYKFKFGYHDIEDMRQQISIFAIEGLKNYDHKRPLENFLWTHVRNRLFNYKRDNYQRPDKPCLACPLYDPQQKESFSGCKKYDNKNDCELYSSWNKRNSSKKNLMHLTTIDEVKNYSNAFKDDNNEEPLLNSITNQEIIRILEEKLVDDYRIIYLKLKSGSKVNKIDQTKLLNKIKEIIGEQHE
jgi:DNA-directed RNA polymerase specialized sigma24 family protein